MHLYVSQAMHCFLPWGIHENNDEHHEKFICTLNISLVIVHNIKHVFVHAIMRNVWVYDKMNVFVHTMLRYVYLCIHEKCVNIYIHEEGMTAYLEICISSYTQQCIGTFYEKCMSVNDEALGAENSWTYKKAQDIPSTFLESPKKRWASPKVKH